MDWLVILDTWLFSKYTYHEESIITLAWVNSFSKGRRFIKGYMITILC